MRELDVASASGVARRGDRIFVIADDLRELAVYRLSRPNEPGERRTVLAERDGAGKPDVECLTLLPPFEAAPHGCLLGLGSGSEPDRNRGFAWVLAPDGDLAGAPVELDLTPLWDLLREHAGALNVEGAAHVGDQLWIFNRGNSAQGRNLVAEVSLDDVVRSIRGDHRLDRCELGAVRTYDLGSLEGVPLAFSDATRWPTSSSSSPPRPSRTMATAPTARSAAPSSAPSMRPERCAACAPSTAGGRSKASTPRSMRAWSTSCSSAIRTTRTPPSPLLVASMPVEARWDS